MLIIVALLFIIRVFHGECRKQFTAKYTEVPVDCGGQTNMDQHLRREAIIHHNFKRLHLADGSVFDEDRGLKFPTASDMNALYYDCGLEIEAHEIALQCHNGGPDFGYVGSNNKTFPVGDLPNVEMIVDSWWKTLPKDENLVGLKPQEMNKPMIPFLQMVNGRTNKVGCAYHICGQDYYDQYVHPFILFVCKYGHPLIKIGDPIYTVGPPCDSCKSRCLHGALCDTMLGRY